MAIEKTLGGDRLGSGNKQKTRMHNYERSTHNLSESWKSTASAGILYPCYVNIGLNGDTFEIKTDAGVKTIPTVGPLYGSFKLQIDYFACPIRLYQGILHNNPINIGLNMSQVMLPMMRFTQRQRGWETNGSTYAEGYEIYYKQTKFNPSSLEKYLGLDGLGVNKSIEPVPGEEGFWYHRSIQCVPELAYFDIFKQYYANKQEENAYVITAENVESETTELASMTILNANRTELSYVEEEDDQLTNADYGQTFLESTKYVTITGTKLDPKTVYFTFNDPVRGQYTKSIEDLYNEGVIVYTKNTAEEITVMYTGVFWYTIKWLETVTRSDYKQVTTSDIFIKPFKLQNIDDMRYRILAHTQLGQPFTIKKTSHGSTDENANNAILPYSVLLYETPAGESYNTLPLNGLVLKTYQSDIFNAWVQTEWIDGENGINAITSVQTTDGSFTIDSLILANKVYNMLNRIAVSGGTYQDWQEAVYGEKASLHAETPIYLGGMSSEVEFDEVVSTAASDEQPLGTIGGRGALKGKKGGHIICKCTEPTLIMAIMSLTPRIDQTQGNAWYRTELKSINDVHKPALDQIGFEDLREEQMASFACDRRDGRPQVQPAVGKVPAWINYMTAYDKAYGNFVEKTKDGYMILGRNYEIDETDGNIKDATTYIDPTKYNYAFADGRLEAQNFWVQVYHNVKARRKMSAKQIPNL